MVARKYKTLLVSIAIVTLLFAGIFIWLGPQNVWNALTKAKPEYLALAVLVEAIDLFFLNIRWHVFVKPVYPKIRIRDTMQLSLSGAAVSNITPGGRVGGEPLKAYFMKRVWGISYSASFATIVVERIVDMFAFMIISGIAILYGVYLVHLSKTVMALLITAFLFSASILLGLWYFTLRKKIKTSKINRFLAKHNWIMKRIPVLNYYEKELEKYVNKYYDYVFEIANNKRVMVTGFIFSTIYWLLEMTRAYTIFLALGVNASFPIIALAYIFSTVVGSLPVSVGGVGLTEGTMIVIYSASNINTVIASLETMIDRLLSYWLLMIIGLPIAGYLGLKPGEEIENGGLHDSTGEGSEERKVRDN